MSTARAAIRGTASLRCYPGSAVSSLALEVDPMTVERAQDRSEAGARARQEVPRSAHAEWTPGPVKR